MEDRWKGRGEGGRRVRGRDDGQMLEKKGEEWMSITGGLKDGDEGKNENWMER